ncbi:MAG: sigma-54-dependent Fis family transcriptional regulator [Ignavibacteriae bacterium HGW-Ignavibacteriae-4]|jgi:transcriptional regulator with PAS, ATPase and Fis domain|nr:MAG: sigma-54-dependent Fis family transcriptional regulator [Ignavibacteriae bacterium HGW-Ignavibacteriae-4]
MSDYREMPFHFDRNFIDLFMHVFETVPIPMIIVDQQQKIQLLNKAYGNFLNKEKKDVIGKKIMDVITNSRIPIVLQTGDAEIAWRHSFINGQEAIVHRIPIKENGIVIGCFGMLLFNTLEELQEVADRYKKLEHELRYYKKELRSMQKAKYSLTNIIGISPKIKETKDKLLRIAQSKSTVLIMGESGVGKELFAHAIHNASSRSEYPFIRLNCAAIPEALFESELFGYEEGAFTGAKKGGKAGKFELANGGTLFLDEIGDIPLFLQAKLLRVLQEKELDKVGSKKSSPIDVRIVAATNKNLESLVEKGLFRHDLYFRLNILNLIVPPLREREEDIPLLISHLLSTLNDELGVYKTISENVVELLTRYNWPGNVRELMNVIEKMLLNSEESILTIRDIPFYILQNDKTPQKTSDNEGLDNSLEKFEKETIQRILLLTNGNIKKSSEILQIPRPRLYRKIRKYNLL